MFVDSLAPPMLPPSMSWKKLQAARDQLTIRFATSWCTLDGIFFAHRTRVTRKSWSDIDHLMQAIPVKWRCSAQFEGRSAQLLESRHLRLRRNRSRDITQSAVCRPAQSQVQCAARMKSERCSVSVLPGLLKAFSRSSHSWKFLMFPLYSRRLAGSFFSRPAGMHAQQLH